LLTGWLAGTQAGKLPLAVPLPPLLACLLSSLGCLLASWIAACPAGCHALLPCWLAGLLACCRNTLEDKFKFVKILKNKENSVAPCCRAVQPRIPYMIIYDFIMKHGLHAQKANDASFVHVPLV
jgi:hypothetical protein